MTLHKQSVPINFSKGIQTKVDEFQIPPGEFLALENSVFTKAGLLQKRNGFGALTSVSNASTLTTYKDGLLAIGTTLSAYSADNKQIINAGNIQPMAVATQALVRAATSQTTVDTAVTSTGLTCSVWLDSDGSTYYQVADSVTGQTVVPKVALPATAVIPRVTVLGAYFIVTFLATVSATTHLRYIAIPINNPASPNPAVDLSTQVNGLSAAYNIVSTANYMYFTWVSNVGGNAVKVSYLTPQLVAGSTQTVAGETGTLLSVAFDTFNSNVWVSIYSSGTSLIRVTAYDGLLLGQTLAPTTVVSAITINEITSTVINRTLTVFYEVANTYSYSPNAKTDYVAKNTITSAGVVGTPSIIIRSVGLASKAIYVPAMLKSFMLVAYGGAFQPTYFLIDSSGNVLSKLAYSNGGGYELNQTLPAMYLFGSTLQVGYLFKDLLAAVNKTQGIANVAGVYAQTGINIASFTFNDLVTTSEIGQDLHMTGGMLWMYDGVKAVEHGFHVWPEDIALVGHTTGGLMTAQQYFYQVTYEWTDNQGNIHRSAPSVPITVTTTGTTSSVTLNIPTLRLTYKIANKVRIVVYRWSAGQQSYYRVTSIQSPLLNDPTTDSVAYLDTQADSAILGNDLIYTTGGVVENIGAPACLDVSLFKSRLVLVDAEDPDLLWFSKQCVQGVPVETSDLFTIFVAPTTGAQGSTGKTAFTAPMDDKLIIFKKDAIYYLTGNGPDNTGANNDFSEPVFITATVGSVNKASVVFVPSGLMFQSDKGIWLLGRDLSTSYIGAAVEAYNDQAVLSAVGVPGTNQVRFNLSGGLVLMYDYFYNQWGSFSNISGISATLYNGLHTYLNKFGLIFQETPGVYLDGSSPVLLSFQTGWFNLAGLQGYQRAYYFFMLASFFSPHKIQVQIAYDYAPAPSQSMVIVPLNYNGTYGTSSPYGSPQGQPYGGSPNLEQWRVFFQQQRCQAFQIYLNEIFDSSYGATAGAGFTMSGLNLILGMKKGFTIIKAANSIG